ncbi:MAG: hypothetical protein HGB01_06345 [Chlorobiaceae bacterium]|nr:hypothetical protein [Chlorobiaceae bacterium]
MQSLLKDIVFAIGFACLGRATVYKTTSSWQKSVCATEMAYLVTSLCGVLLMHTGLFLSIFSGI